MSDKTPFVVGGVYGKEVHGMYRTGVLVATSRASGSSLREGQLQFYGLPPTTVLEGRGDLDSWRLLAVPVELPMLEALTAIIKGDVLSRLEALEGSGSDDEDLMMPDPSPGSGPIDPKAALKAALSRVS